MHKYLVAAGIDEAKFAETVEEEADVGAGYADHHLGQGLQAHLERDWDGLPFGTALGLNPPHPSEAFFAGAELMGDQVRFCADAEVESMDVRNRSANSGSLGAGPSLPASLYAQWCCAGARSPWRCGLSDRPDSIRPRSCLREEWR
jgi:hypothetical protein